MLRVVKRLAATGLYEYVEPDYIRTTTVVPNDPSFEASQWSLNNTGQEGGTPGADIGALAAWDIWTAQFSKKSGQDSRQKIETRPKAR